MPHVQVAGLLECCTHRGHQQPGVGRYHQAVIAQHDHAVYMQLPQCWPVPGVSLPHIHTAVPRQRVEIQLERAEQTLAQQALQLIDMTGVQAADSGELPLIKGQLITLHRSGVLRVQTADAADGADAKTELIAVAMQRVADDIVVQRTDLLSHGQVIMGQDEFAQPDIAITRSAQLLDTMPVHRQGIRR